MTGAGFAAGESEVGAVRVEVRSVNGRGLTVKQRLSSGCAGFEAAIEQQVRACLRRGSVTVVVERANRGAALPDRETLCSVARELGDLSAELGLEPPTIADVVQIASGSRGESATSRPLPPLLAGLFEQALAQLREHRGKEGAGTVAAIAAQLDEFTRLADLVATRAPQLIAEYRARLLQRVQEFVAANVPEPPPAVDLVREVAVFADKVDVAEELQRLRAHLTEIRSLLAT
ncbi:MAG TPA: DUF1732 domain-containing protein, partial [bacterium]|nr:DUF1732 domain-containing protein [bacterium]